MDPDHSIGFFLPILVSLLFFAAFFSAAETAIVGLSSAKARSLISQKKTRC
jgi:Mg2+/Co2+ transporter CorB